jgi:lipoprotein-releasing system permease protein
MYKLLLCWRYLRTRYIALASIISVTLGVATMIVVNSVMQGFSTEMQSRIHGIISDLVFEARSLDGMPDAAWHEEQIRRVAGDQIESMSATVVVPAMLNFRYGGNWITRQVQLIGIDEKTQSSVSDFSRYLQHPENQKAMSFDLREGGYDVRDHQGNADAPERKQMADAGWAHRRESARINKFQEGFSRKNANGSATPEKPNPQGATPGAAPASGATPSASGAMPTLGVGTKEASGAMPTLGVGMKAAGVNQASRAADDKREASLPPPLADPFATQAPEGSCFDPEKQQHTGAVLGIAMTSFRRSTGEDCFYAVPGDDVKLTFPTVGQPPKAESANFTIVDFYESKMSEYDSSFVFVPIRKLQELRGMVDPTTGIGLINAIQIRLKPGADGDAVRDKLRAAFLPEMYGIYPWRDKQGPLLAAVQMETTILNLLLFLIIAVAGFGILAIFFMIVVEKTHDIGILKSLGAPARGVMGIFLGYGLSLGIVGSGVGMILGLLIVRHINEIADGLARFTGRPVFDPSIYYFYKIPAIIQPATVAWIVGGALAIAVAASILPARRAARLHPVEALRYE